MDCLVSPKVSKDDIQKQFPSSIIMELPSGQDYMRIVPNIEIKRNYKK